MNHLTTVIVLLLSVLTKAELPSLLGLVPGKGLNLAQSAQAEYGASDDTNNPLAAVLQNVLSSTNPADPVSSQILVQLLEILLRPTPSRSGISLSRDNMPLLQSFLNQQRSFSDNKFLQQIVDALKPEPTIVEPSLDIDGTFGWLDILGK